MGTEIVTPVEEMVEETTKSDCLSGKKIYLEKKKDVNEQVVCKSANG